MDQFIMVLTVAALLGAALVAGVFFAFSTFVIKGLARIPPSHAMGAMQSINVTVFNPLFMGAFVGTTVLSITAIIVAVLGWGRPWALYLFGGGVLYVLGTFLVTGLGNVPLNNELDALTPDDSGAAPVWRRYVTRWTALNHVRTAAAIAAALSYCLGLVRFVAA